MRTTALAPWLIVTVAMVEFTYGAQTVQLVVYAKHSLALGSGGYGVLLTAAGVGGLVSALANGRLSTGRRVSLIVIVTGSLACATQFGYAAVQVPAIALAVTVLEVPVSSRARWSVRRSWRASPLVRRSGV